MIRQLLPDHVASAECFGEDAQAHLFPAERLAIAPALGGRLDEFTTGRACARKALAHFGMPPVAIPHCRDNGPHWPDGFVGSITHCRGYRAAAVARQPQVLSIGIDAETAQPVSARVTENIALPSEREWLRHRPPVLATVLFSIKESIYKAWHPLAKRWLGFRDAEVTLLPGGAFTARLLVPAPAALGGGLSGRYLIGDRFILAATVVPHAPDA